MTSGAARGGGAEAAPAPEPVGGRCPALLGSWRGTHRLRRTEAEPWRESPVDLVVRSAAAGLALVVDYAWEEPAGAAQHGLLVVTAEEGASVVAAWVDTWHQRQPRLDCAGSLDPEVGLELTGGYADEAHWRIVLAPRERGLHLEMHDLVEGRASLVVEGDLEREE